MSHRVYGAVLLAIGVIVVVVVASLLAKPDPPLEVDERAETITRSPARTAERRHEQRTAARQPRTTNTEHRTTNNEQRTTNNERRGTTNVEKRTTNDEPRKTNDEPTTNNAWNDPVNAQVLGRRDWMAPISEEEQARIDEVFAKARAARVDPHLSNIGRATSIEVAKDVITACFESLQARQPEASGRLIVAWTSGASGGEGWIKGPRIEVNYKLDEAEFEACILDGLTGRRFPADDGEQIEIEAPFFFDGTF